jgi:hypothetical protein
MHPPTPVDPAIIPVALHDAIGRLVAESDRTIREYEVTDLGLGLKLVTVAYASWSQNADPRLEQFVFASAGTDTGPSWSPIHRQPIRQS